MSAPLLAVRDLETCFSGPDGPLHVVRGVSLDLAPRETLGLVGESGCGKTVTALSIIGLLPSAARIAGGTVVLDGHDLTRMSSRALRRVRGRRIAMVFQDSMTSLNPIVAVGTQITESLETHLGLGGRKARLRAIELLEDVGVPDPEERLRQFPHQLSGGLRQRVAVAVALAADPDVLVADEPTTALDVTIQAQILDLLERKQAERGMALMLITHDLGVVARMCDRVAVMYAGRVVEEGPTDAVLSAPRHPYTLGLLRSVPRLDGEIVERLPSIAGVPPAPGALPGGCPFRPRCPFAFERCEHEDPALEAAGAEGQAAACWAEVQMGAS